MSHSKPESKKVTVASPAIAIDLGTTYSRVAVVQNGAVVIIADDRGNRTTPSYVAFTETERLLGDAAKSQAVTNPENTVFNVKRLIGRKFSDPVVQAEVQRWPFKITRGPENTPMIEVKHKGEKRSFSAEQISSMLLLKLKKTAEAYLGKEVKNAVVTVPGFFNVSQRRATRDAGAIAGLDVLRMINEPSAAALAYGLDKVGQEDNLNILIFDLGGGALDVSLFVVEDHVFEVRATAEDPLLGGEDFDSRLVDYFMVEFKIKTKGKDMSKDERAKRRLRTACESAKRTLSTSTQAHIEIDGLFDGADFVFDLTRDRFEDLCMHLFEATLKPVERVLRDSNMSKDSIHEVVLVGGSSRIPKVQSLLSDFFGGKTLNTSMELDDSVAIGAAVQAAIVSSEFMNPDDSLGAAVQDATVSRDSKQANIDRLLVLDATSSPKGLGDFRKPWCIPGVIPVVERNTHLPCKRVYTLPAQFIENQSDGLIKVLEGEDSSAQDSDLLGEFHLPIELRGRPVELVFEVDTSGLLEVSTTNPSTGQSFQFQWDKTRFTDADIERMKAENESFKPRVEAPA